MPSNLRQNVKYVQPADTNAADESSLCLCGALFLDCGCCCLRSIPRSRCYAHYSLTTADSGGRWCDRRDTVAISFSGYEFKERVHCSPDQVTERVIFAAGLGFYLQVVIQSNN